MIFILFLCLFLPWFLFLRLGSGVHEEVGFVVDEHVFAAFFLELFYLSLLFPLDQGLCQVDAPVESLHVLALWH